MIHLLVSILLTTALVYVVSGVVFSFFFVYRGIEKIDEDVPGSSWGFRIIIIPGCVLLWPLLLSKWIKANRN
jgi:hypothetical protein